MPGKLVPDIGYQLAKLPRQGKADGIAERNETHALFIDGFAHLQNEVMLGACGIFQREINVFGQSAARAQPLSVPFPAPLRESCPA